MLTLRSDYDKMFSNILNEAEKYLNDNKNLKSLIIGLSGGIDSALACAIASELLKRVPGVKLIGRSLPIETNTPEETSRGENIGRNFCHHFETKDLTQAYRNLYEAIVSKTSRMSDETAEEKIRRGNVKVRTRMVYLFDLAHYEKGMVLSTDNYTELLLGFWTLHGDVGNYGFIQYLWKTEVYGLARYLANEFIKRGETGKADALQACIDALPTDGLGITKSDFDQIGVNNYETADLLLLDFLKGRSTPAGHPIIERYHRSAFKRVDPQNIPRDKIIG